MSFVRGFLWSVPVLSLVSLFMYIYREGVRASGFRETLLSEEKIGRKSGIPILVIGTRWSTQESDFFFVFYCVA